MRNRIHLCLAHTSGKELEYIKEAFDTNWVVPIGPNVDAFEEELENFVNAQCPIHNSQLSRNAGNYELTKSVVALSSGTAALHLALVASGVGEGDEVLAQTFSFCASANPIRYVGARPVFIDSEADTWNMSPELMEEAIIEREKITGKKPKAAIVVDIYGMPAKMKEISEICDRHGVIMIEDAANAMGSKYNGQMCGTFGKYGVLSFNGNKMITTSGGGALICPDKAAKQEIMFYATQAREAYPYYHHEHVGYNYRMSNICAGIGRGQMTVAQEHINHHKHIQSLYLNLFKEVKGITLHENPSELYDSNFWLCTIILDESLRIKGEEKAYEATIQGAVGGAAGVTHAALSLHTDCEPNANVEALRLVLDAGGIEARPLWKPMHRQPVYSHAPAYVNGVSESLFKQGLCLPSGPCVTDDDVRYIVEQIKANII